MKRVFKHEELTKDREEVHTFQTRVDLKLWERADQLRRKHNHSWVSIATKALEQYLLDFGKK